MTPIVVVVAIINLLANINNYNIPDDPELRNIRVRRDNVASVHRQDANIKTILQGDLYGRREKRAYGSYKYNAMQTTTPYSLINNVYNGGYQQNTATPYSTTHKWQYNPYNIPPIGQQQRQQPIYNQQQQQPVYNQQQPLYNRQQSVYNQQTPRTKVTVETTTPQIACIICDIGCPAFMKKMGIFCVSDSDDEDNDDYL